MGIHQPRSLRRYARRVGRGGPMSLIIARRCVRGSLTRVLLRTVQHDPVSKFDGAVPKSLVSGRRLLSDKAGGKHDEVMRGLPESRVPIVEDQSIPATEEEFARRRASALRHWMENELGKERAALTALLAKHGVKIQGGAEEAKAFVEELIEWKADAVVSGIGHSDDE